MAIADASYFDWPVLPEAPSGLEVAFVESNDVTRHFIGSCTVEPIIIERRTGEYGQPGSENLARLLRTKYHRLVRAP